MTNSSGLRGAASRLRDEACDLALRACVRVEVLRARHRPAAWPRLAPQAAAAGAFMLLAAQPAHAQIIQQWGDEMLSWQQTFDADLVPIAVTAGLLASLVAAMFSRMAGAVVFVFTVAGAFMYGARDDIVGIAGGG